MQFHHFNAELGRGIYLLQSWIDKKADANARKLQAFNGRFQFLALSDDIKPAFGGNFFTLFRDETDLLRLDAQRDIDDRLSVAHLQIQLGHDALAQALDVSLLNVAAICAQMRDKPRSTGSLAN